MDNRLKAGIISGLIAGIVLSILSAYLPKINHSIGLWSGPIGQAVSNSIASNVLISIIFGTVLGIIFLWVHSVIPGRMSLKGLYFGLIIFLIYAVRDSTFTLAYGDILWATGEILFGFFRWIPYGLVLGVLYKFLCSKYYPIKELKIKEYNMIDGIHLGAIAGIVGGLAASFANIFGIAIVGLFEIPISGFPEMPTLDIWISQTGTHTFINMLWGTIFGGMFTKVYNIVPSKGIVKGIIYGLSVFFISSFQSGIMNFGWGLSSSMKFWISIGIWTIFVGFFNAFFFGLVIGLLYKPKK